jgi:hypothetical protein
MNTLFNLLESVTLSPSLLTEKVTNGFVWNGYKVTIRHDYSESCGAFCTIFNIVDVDAQASVWHWGCDTTLNKEEKDAVEMIMHLRGKTFSILYDKKDVAEQEFNAKFN